VRSIPLPPPPAEAPLGLAARWYCVRSQVKREHVAAAHLVERAGVEVFAPRIRAVHGNHLGGVTHTLEALFPGYVFARFDYVAQSRLVISTAGVRGVVAFGGPPPPVPDPVINGLRREIAGQAGMAAAPVLREGAWVRVLTGCFRFLEGRMVQVDPRSDRVRVLLDLLGGEVHVTLPAHQVTPLGEATVRYPSGLLQSAAAPALRRAG
jgi:transcriptional antiterminator RfaH